MELLYWKDPAKSAAVFLPVFAVLTALLCWSLFYVLAWTGLTVLLGVASLRALDFVMSKLGKPNPLGDPIATIKKVDVVVSEEAMGNMLGSALATLNAATNKTKQIVLFQDVLETVKFAGWCYSMTYIGSWFNASTLVLLGWVAAFVLPKLYLNNKAVVDEIFGKVMVQVNSIKEKVGGTPPAKQE